MACAEHTHPFSEDKQRFFSTVRPIEDVKKLAETKDYSFLVNNRLMIEQELNQMFEGLKQQGNDREAFWLYCYYCCLMMQNYYESYGKSSKAQEYRDKSAECRHQFMFGKEKQKKDKTILESIHQDLKTLADTPNHISKIRDWVAFFNIRRLHLAYTRLFIRQAIVAANEFLWFDKINQLLGTSLNPNDMVAKINAPAPIFNVLSVAFFSTRLAINSSMVIKHTFFPSSEQEKSLGALKRFQQELYLRHAVLLNDLVWSTINLLTNFAPLFKISAPVANGLTGGFLVFDVALLIYRRRLAENEFLYKKEQYLLEKRNIEAILANTKLSSDSRKMHQAHYDMLVEQIKQLEISRQTEDRKLLFNIAAATLLVAGFSASVLFAMPAAIVACYLVCNIGVAMYLTAETFGAYQEKSLRLKQAQQDMRDVTKAQKEFDAARNAFFLSITKNIVATMLIVSIFAVSWQAALVFTALYVGYECLQGYFKNSPTKQPLANKPTAEPVCELEGVRP